MEYLGTPADTNDRLMRLKDAILAINGSILQVTGISQLFDVILEKLLDAVDHANVGCVLLHDGDGMLRIASARGYPTAKLDGFRLRVEETFQWKKKKGHLDETLIINNLQDFMRLFEIPGNLLRDVDGNIINSTMSSPLIVEGKFLGLINLDSRENDVFDETDRLLAEYVRSQIPIAVGLFSAYEREKKAHEEKELILREVHHRIKNNMYMIDSALRLQRETLADPVARMALDDACNRVRSMMVLYDKLYLDSDFKYSSLARFLPDLVDQIIGNSAAAARVEIEEKVADIAIGTKHMQALGIIVNEVVTNSVKYAFRGRTEGRISISVEERDGRVLMEIGDDGPGLPDGIAFGSSSGFGLMLVENLTEQLGGTIRMERGRGTRFVFDFSAALLLS